MSEAADTATFDDLASRYDRLVDWPSRLAREGPFFRALFSRHDVRRVLDAGCGTGHHAAMFHGWGLSVVGCDLSPVMLDRCARLHGTDDRLRWERRPLEDPPDGPFDAVVCLGNTLALAADHESVARTVRSLTAALRPGGVAVAQVLNLAAIEPGPTIWQKVRRFDDAGTPVLLLKGIHRVAERGHIDVVELRLVDQSVEWFARPASFLGLSRTGLESAISVAGGAVRQVSGSYGGEAFDASRSGDLIVTWERRASPDSP